MEKRALLAIVLSVAVMAVWQIWFAPEVPVAPDPVPAAGEPAAQADAVAPQPVAPVAPDPAPVASPEATPSAPAVAAVQEEEFRVRTESHDLRLANRGGRVLWWRLPKYTKNEDIPMDLIPSRAVRADVLPLQVEIPGDAALTDRLAGALFVHEVTGRRDPATGQPGRRIDFTWSDGAGIEARKSLWIPEDGYLTRFGVEITRHGQPVEAAVVIASGMAETNGDDGTHHIWAVDGRAVWLGPGGVERVAAEDVEAPTAPGSVAWAGLESTYFAALALPPDGEAPRVGYTPRTAPPLTAGEEPEPIVSASVITTQGRIDQPVFVGPKDYALLEQMGHGLERVIDFSSISLIYWITRYLFRGLVWINSHIGNYGWSIILMTFIVRLAFFPITYRSMITMRQTSKKMAKVQPKVKGIQEKYRKQKRSVETQQKMNQEIMALYKKEGVNPMASVGGCLPLLLQMPIFIGFYNLLSVTIEVRQAPFIGWIQDLSQRDPYYITPVLMGASWILQQMMTSSSIPDPMQRRMMMLMPVIFTFMMMNMPSGLVIYWLTSNILGMAQQYVINRKADSMAAPVTRPPEGERKLRRARQEAAAADPQAEVEPEAQRADNG